MATETESFLDTKVGGFLAGLGIGTVLAFTIWYAPVIVVRAVLPRLPGIFSKKFAEFVVHDAFIGRVPLLNLERRILSASTIGGTIFTISFWAFGGGHQLLEWGKSMLGIPISGTGLPDEDKVTPVGSLQQVIGMQSEFGRVTMVALNGARRDP